MTSHELFLARTEVAMRGHAALPLPPAAGPQAVVAAGLALLGKPARSWRKPKLQVWLSAGWCRPLLVPQVSGLKSWEEAEALVLAQAKDQAALGLEGGAAVWLNGWPGDAEQLACVMSQTMLQTLKQLVPQAGYSLTAVRPWWSSPSAVPDVAAKAPSLLMAECPDGVTLLKALDSKVTWANAWLPAPQGAAREAMLQRLSLSHGQTPINRVLWRAAVEKGTE